MNKEELFNIAEKLKRIAKKENSVNFIPRQTLSVDINGKKCYISLICDDDFKVQVVVLDENNHIISKILEIDGDRASIVELQNSIYVFTADTAYIYDVNYLISPITTLYLGNLDLQGICANQDYIFAYSTIKDVIIKYDKNLIPLQEYENSYSKKNSRVSLALTCNQDTCFSIPIISLKEEQHILMKQLMEHYVGKEIASQNDFIHSCSFNNDENTLYISMYNLIWIIKNGTEFGYLYFKDHAITTVFYDNDIKKLIVGFGGVKGNHVQGSIIKLSDHEIKEKAISLDDVSLMSPYSNIFEGISEQFRRL